jgi:hypothetical protein
VNSSTNTVYLDIPIRYAMKTRDNARIYRAPAMIEEVGVEYLSIGNTQNNKNGWGEEEYNTSGNGAYDTHASYVLSFTRVRNSWIRAVETFQPSGNGSTAHILSNGILLTESRSVTIDSCHFQRPQFGGGGGNGYMYRFAAQENLIKNTNATFARHGFVFSQMFASGNVFHKCTDKDGGKQTGLSGNMSTAGRGSDHHMHFSHSNLFDHCTVNNSNLQAAYRPYGSAPLHNLTAAHSVYWNIHGLGSWAEVVHTQQARYGYAIGTWGEVTAVKTSAVGGSEAKTAPVDHVEGVGAGETLEPQSLYLDQLQKRIGGLSSTKIPSPANQASMKLISLSRSELRLAVPAGKYRIELFALTGRRVADVKSPDFSRAGVNTLPLKGFGLTNATYLVKVTGENSHAYFKTVLRVCPDN